MKSTVHVQEHQAESPMVLQHKLLVDSWVLCTEPHSQNSFCSAPGWLWCPSSYICWFQLTSHVKMLFLPSMDKQIHTVLSLFLPKLLPWDNPMPISPSASWWPTVWKLSSWEVYNSIGLGCSLMLLMSFGELDNCVPKKCPRWKQALGSWVGFRRPGGVVINLEAWTVVLPYSGQDCPLMHVDAAMDG
jgi:hypothetical protein